MEGLRYAPEAERKKGKFKQRTIRLVSKHLGESKMAHAGRRLLGEINSQESKK